MRAEEAERARAAMAARAVHSEYAAYYAEFKEIMGRSRGRFEARDWAGLSADADERVSLYQRAIDRTASFLEDTADGEVHTPGFWDRMREAYWALSADPQEGDLARAYFSSVKRRFLPVAGEELSPGPLDVAHDEDLVEEVVGLEIGHGPRAVEELLLDILALFPLQAPWPMRQPEVGQAAALLEDRLAEARGRRVTVLKPLFFRGRRAHIVGRIWRLGRFDPLVVVLTHLEDGLHLAEVLLGEEETSSLFSFTRSQFHVVTHHHRELMHFLKSLAPTKSAADLYASVGYNNLAKSALLADFFRLCQEGERFRRPPGISGTVMFAFELPRSRFVIKLIRDKFLARRVETNREKVMRRYRFVQYAERVGRILDIFHFHHVRFEVAWFDPALLQELLAGAPSKITLDGEHVILNEFYVQRKVIPLDVFFRRPEDPAVLRRVMIDFGFLHKELAQRNIFTGDVVPNNFGVVSVGRRNMRVVSFDYDGYSRVTDMRFLYQGGGGRGGGGPWDVYDDWESPEDSMVIDEEWDVLPEKFRVTFGVPPELREEFERVHGELYDPGWWNRVQAELRRRPELVDGFPYPMIAR